MTLAADTAALGLPPERVYYRPCAVCQQRMNRKNFGGASGVIVDVGNVAKDLLEFVVEVLTTHRH